MNTKAKGEIGDGTTPQDRARRPRLSGIKSAMAGLFLVSLSASGLAQSFQNLGFESAQLVPLGGSSMGEVQPSPAFPGWAVYWDTNAAPFVLYDNMALDSVN